MDRLFLDTNVLLDVLEKRSPWFPESAACISKVRQKQCLGAISVISLSDIAYIQRKVPPVKLYEVFRQLRSFLEVADCNAKVVDASFRRELKDIEDGFQFEAALGWGATHFLTRNVKEFPDIGDVIVQRPADYLGGR